MSDQWYCLIDQKKYGPFQWLRLQELAGSGRLRPEHLLQSGTGPWVPAGTMHGLFAVTPSQPSPPIVQPTMQAPPQFSAPPVPQQFLSPPQNSAPQALPMGLPVGQVPVGIPQGIPAGIPVGVPAGIARPPAPPSFAVTPPPAPSRANRGVATMPEERDHTTLLFIGGGSFAAIALVIGILAARGVFSSAKPQPVAQTPVANITPVNEPATSPADAEAAAAAVTAKADPSAQQEKKSNSSDPTKGAGPTDSQLSAEIAAISQWRDASKVSGLKVGKIQFGLKDVWLAANAFGEPVSGDGNADETDKPKFLCVAVRIANDPGAAPVNYLGWNDSAVGAKLVGADGAILVPRPVEAGGTIPRLGAKKIAPGESQIDTIVFELPAEFDLTKFRVAFPKSTLLAGQKGFFAYEIPEQVLGAPADLAAVGGKPNRAAPQAMAAGDEPAAKPAMKKPRGDGPIPIPGLGGGKNDGEPEMDDKEAEVQAKMEKLRQEREKMKGKEPADEAEMKKPSTPDKSEDENEK